MPRLFPEIFAPIHNFQQRVLLDGNLHPFPLSPEVIFSRLSSLQKLAVAPEILARTVWREIATTESRLDLESWIRRRPGAAIYRAAGLSGYLQKLMGLPAGELHRNLGIKRPEKIDLQTRHKALARRGLNKLPGIQYDDSEVMSSAPPRFMYPLHGGAGSIAEHDWKRITSYSDFRPTSAAERETALGIEVPMPTSSGDDSPPTRCCRSGAPLTEVALRSGFYDQSHFNRAFRQRFDTMPGLYRSRFQER